MIGTRTLLPGTLAAVAGLFLIAAVPRAADPPTSDPPPKPAVRPAVKVAAEVDAEIDKLLKQENVPASPAADDAEFMRRAYFDLTGRLPTAEQAVAFLDSKEPDKRARLIDELLDSPNYGRHFGIIWSDTIVKRDENNRGMKTDDFKKWLADNFNKSRPWGEMVRDMITAEGATDKVPQATFVAAHREMTNFSPPKMVGTTANLFMGVQLQCAECHKHPFISGWKQEDFWGVAAFFTKTKTTGAAKQMPNAALTIAEDASGGGGRPGVGRGRATGASIEIPDSTDPRKRTNRIVKAKFFLSDEPKIDDKEPFRPTLAKWLTAPENKYFANNTVNRLWAHFFARGLVNPLDDFQDANPPSHPELLKLLAKEFTESGQDLKHVIRVLCNTKAYQRTSKPAKGNELDEKLVSHMKVKVMSPEVLYDALTQSMDVTDLGRTLRGGGGGGGMRGGPPTGRDEFVNFFTTKEEGDDPNEFGFGVPQFLRLMNSARFNQNAPMVDRLMKADASRAKVIEGLFLVTLSRRPTEGEAKKFADFVAKKSDAKAGYNAALWVLLNSAEYVCVK